MRFRINKDLATLLLAALIMLACMTDLEASDDIVGIPELFDACAEFTVIDYEGIQYEVERIQLVNYGYLPLIIINDDLKGMLYTYDCMIDGALILETTPADVHDPDATGYVDFRGTEVPLFAGGFE